MKKEKQFVTIAEYAFLCGVTKAAIYRRISKDQLKSEVKSNGKIQGYVIDKLAYPPKKWKPGPIKFTF